MPKGTEVKPDFVPVGNNPVKGQVHPKDEVLSSVDKGKDFVKQGETATPKN